MKIEQARAYTAKCFHGEPASCSHACPFHLNIRSFLEKVRNGKWALAYKDLRDATVFPVIASILCDQPCRTHCQRTLLGDEAIALREIEAACLKYVKSQKAGSYFIPPKNKRIAVVGAGMAGLACALTLAQKKFPVSVFDKNSGWGGSLRSNPGFDRFEADIALQFSVVTVEFHFETEIKAIEELAEFDAVYIATGRGGDSFGLLQSWDDGILATSLPKVFMGGELCGVTLMEGIAQGKKVSKTIEVFFQTGKANRTFGDYDKNNRERYLKHDGAVSVPRIVPSSPDGCYTEEETKAEAARCLQCDCNNCMASCEMLQHFRKDPHKLAIEVYTDTQVNPPLSSHTLTRETYSCNICGHCKSVCPENVDVGALLQLSRTARMSAGTNPAALHDFWLREMDFTSSEASFSSAPKGKETCKYAFFPGCQHGAANPEYVFRAYEFLSDKYDTGIFIGCCGAPAYWAGDEARLSANIENQKRSWRDMGEPTLVFACATCERVFNMFLPDIKRVSLYELLAETEEISPTRAFPEAVVFDPCAAGDNNRMRLGVRILARKAGVDLEELGDPNRCCGYGGHMRLANPSLYEKITENRAQASEKPYIVYCVNCREVFALRNKESRHILDMVFGLQPGFAVPSLQQKRDNSLKVKKTLMQEKWGIDFTPKTYEWDGLTLIITTEMQKSMDEKVIFATEIKEAIWLAEGSGDKFYNETDDLYLCSMVKTVVTYWVEYKRIAPNTYEVLSAYSHRMRFKKEE